MKIDALSDFDLPAALFKILVEFRDAHVPVLSSRYRQGGLPAWVLTETVILRHVVHGRMSVPRPYRLCDNLLFQRRGTVATFEALP